MSTVRTTSTPMILHPPQRMSVLSVDNLFAGSG
jgi:hypothetical protein